jgi:putative resolvase
MGKYEDYEWLKRREAADYLRVTVDTLRRWEKKGIIRPSKVTFGHHLYRKLDLDQMLVEGQYPELATARKELGLNEQGI